MKLKHKEFYDFYGTLTKKEQELMQYIMYGYNLVECSLKLHKSYKTIKNYWHEIKLKYKNYMRGEN
jgi:DNA-binding CsgD family transcriptional regulator